jgi:UDP-2,3-diacylglucosamine hydrolase
VQEPTTIAGQAQPETVALFVSDVHLQHGMPGTAQAFLHFVEKHALQGRRVYVLGDLFEYWAGDDDLATPFNRQIAEALAGLRTHGVEVFWMGGNRDFLVGQEFADAARFTLLTDPYVTRLAGHRIVLTHGDAQCTDDQAYLAFRAMVRDPRWQADFLSKTLTERKKIIAGLRSDSQAAQRNKAQDIMDVNTGAVDSLFAQSGADIMIHGHTHRPAVHLHEVGGIRRVRHVLPDWDCDASARGGWLELRADGSFQRLRVDGSVE